MRGPSKSKVSIKEDEEQFAQNRHHMRSRGYYIAASSACVADFEVIKVQSAKEAL
jgi:hypothetical protein